jgi:hypothetical protein
MAADAISGYWRAPVEVYEKLRKKQNAAAPTN